jgi:uncharacterized protein (TIGR03083 family)
MTNPTTRPATSRTLEDRLWTEVDQIGEMLHELDAADFDHPSLCTGWRVRDVIGHMAFGHTTPMPKIVIELARFRFDVPRGSYELSRAWAADRSPDEIMAVWDRDLVTGRARKGIAKTIPWDQGFLDHFIHQQDIRRPLGRPRSIDEEHLRAALDLLPSVQTKFFATKPVVAGLRWEATDLDWSHGDGPLVRGTGEALIMAAGGRAVALAELDGAGASVLRDRLAAGPDGA